MNQQIIEALKEEQKGIIYEYNLGVKRLESLANQVHSITTLIQKYESRESEPRQTFEPSTPSTGGIEPFEGGQTKQPLQPIEPSIGSNPLDGANTKSSDPIPTPIEPGVKNTSQGTLEDASSKHTGSIVTNFISQQRKVGSSSEDQKSK